MPKIRDLGINVIPETARPLEIGAGGGCGRSYECRQCSYSPADAGYRVCGPTDTCSNMPCGRTYRPPQCGPTDTPWHGTYRPAPYGTAECAAGPTDQCSDYVRPRGYRQEPYGYAHCTGGPTDTCSAVPCKGTHHAGQVQQDYAECTPTDVHSPACAQGGLTREDVARLKAQLQQQIEQLTEYEKSLGPKTLEAIDKREQELKAELEDLARRRQELQK